ncbi:hypothetical protein H4582DRAFT_1895023 [Lactarius indigo]|nr:hypothetical protein H4582DRAFT_1895023 [Lactarius indigo]
MLPLSNIPIYVPLCIPVLNSLLGTINTISRSEQRSLCSGRGAAQRRVLDASSTSSPVTWVPCLLRLCPHAAPTSRATVTWKRAWQTLRCHSPRYWVARLLRHVFKFSRCSPSIYPPCGGPVGGCVIWVLFMFFCAVLWVPGGSNGCEKGPGGCSLTGD